MIVRMIEERIFHPSKNQMIHTNKSQYVEFRLTTKSVFRFDKLSLRPPLSILRKCIECFNDAFRYAYIDLFTEEQYALYNPNYRLPI